MSLLKLDDGGVTAAQRGRLPAAGGEQDQRVEDLVVEAGGVRERGVPALDRGGEPIAQRRILGDVALRGARARTRRGAPRPARRAARPRACTRRARDRGGTTAATGSCPRRAPTSRKLAIAKSGSSNSVASEAWPPAVDRPSSPRRRRARRVNTSMWRASSAAWIASSCITSRKCGWRRREEARRARAAPRSRSRSGTSSPGRSRPRPRADARPARPTGSRSPDPTARPPPARTGARPRRPTPSRRSASGRSSSGAPASTSAPRAASPQRAGGCARRRIDAAGALGAAQRPGPRWIDVDVRQARDVDAMAVRATPRRQIDAERRRRCRAPRRALARERALDQQVRALVEAEVTELDDHHALREPAVERAEPIDRALEQRVAGRAAGPPRLQAFHVEQRPHLRIVVRHREQQLAELRDRGGVRRAP